MNPISSDIFGRLGWLTRQFKNLCCRVGLLETNADQQAANNPCYLEVITNGTEGAGVEFVNILDNWTSSSGEPFTNFVKIITGTSNIYRLYGGKNITITKDVFDKYIVFINDACGAVRVVDELTLSSEFLTYVNLPNAEILNTTAFLNCYNLKINLSLPKVTTIGLSAFEGCEALLSIDFPLVETIGNTCFKNCDSLLTINIPKCTSIGTGGCGSYDGVFENDNNLQTINVAAINATCNSGSPDADIQYAISTLDADINYV